MAPPARGQARIGIHTPHVTWTRTPFPGEPAGAHDRAIVGCQLGRDARGDVGVVVRCNWGLPAVVRTAPLLEDGTPFPTLYYLVCPVAARAAGRLEAAGRMREYESRLTGDPTLAAAYRAAHERYVERRDTLALLDPPVSAGGMPSRVKCLHALVAHDLAESNPVGAMARADLEPLSCPGQCCAERDGAVARVRGHPGFAQR